MSKQLDDLTAALGALTAERDAVYTEREGLLAQVRELGERQAALNTQIRAAEQEAGDVAALDELRERGDVVAVKVIAATMPDPERAAQFAALAAELAPPVPEPAADAAEPSG